MKNWFAALALVACICMLTYGHLSAHNSATAMGEDDFRKMEQKWLDAASVPDLPTLRQMFSDDFMGTSFGGQVLSKDDITSPGAAEAPHMPKCTLKDSTVHIFGDTAVLMGEAEMQVEPKAKEMRITTVFQKHGNGNDWQVIAVHMSKVQEN
jgi:ketosteroid isomerase-like protein